MTAPESDGNRPRRAHHGWTRSHQPICVLILLVGVFYAPRLMWADFKEYEVKAAYIYNFLKFVEWPEDSFDKASSPIVIGILGKDPFGPTLARIVEGKRINDRPIVVNRLKWQEAKRCQILFVRSSESGKVEKLNDLLKGAPVLTIGEVPGFANRGGIINFTLEESRVRFEINVEAAKRSRLSISSKLLSLAKVIK